jgi:D-alanine-D-alanine ligase
VVLAEQFIRAANSGAGAGQRADAPRAARSSRSVAPEGNYDYQNKYFTDDTKYLCPAPLDAASHGDASRR